jgi:hypothetical protein
MSDKVALTPFKNGSVVQSSKRLLANQADLDETMKQYSNDYELIKSLESRQIPIQLPHVTRNKFLKLLGPGEKAQPEPDSAKNSPYYSRNDPYSERNVRFYEEGKRFSHRFDQRDDRYSRPDQRGDRYSRFDQPDDRYSRSDHPDDRYSRQNQRDDRYSRSDQSSQEPERTGRSEDSNVDSQSKEGDVKDLTLVAWSIAINFAAKASIYTSKFHYLISKSKKA